MPHPNGDPALCSLSWGATVKTRHGDAVASWPPAARRASSASIERGKQRLRDEGKAFKFVSQHSACTPAPAGGGYFLYLEVVIRMLSHAAPEHLL